MFGPSVWWGRVESKPLRVFLPGSADELVGSKALECLEALGEVVSHQEGPDVFLEVLMGLVIELLDGGFFQGAVHAFDLAVGPGMVDPGEAVLDAVGHADAVEDVLEGVAVPLVVAELDAVVGEDGMDLVRHSCNQVAQELSGLHLASRRMQLGVDELRGAVDGHEQPQLALFSADFGDVHMKVPDRIGLELLLLRGIVAFDLRQAADAVPLQTAM